MQFWRCKFLLLAALLFVPAYGEAAITEVSANRETCTPGANVDSLVCTFNNNVTSGNKIAAGGAVWDAGNPASIAATSTCSAALTVYLSSADTAFGGQFRRFIAEASATSTGGCAITINPSTGSGSFIAYGIDEFACPSGCVLDVDGGQSTGTGTAPSEGLTVGTNSLVLAVMGYFNTPDTTIAPDGTYTQIGEEETNATTASYNFQFKVASGAETAAWTLGASNDWRAVSIALKESGGSTCGYLVTNVATDQLVTETGDAFTSELGACDEFPLPFKGGRGKMRGR